MNPRILTMLVILLFVVPICGCDNENPFKRKQLSPENNTPLRRYYHSYKMYIHEHKVLERYLDGGGKLKVRHSWARLREHLLGMKENMPEEMAFDFLVIIDEYDAALSLFIKRNKSPRVTLSKITRKRFSIERKYKPSKVYPEKENETKDAAAK